MKKFLEGKMSMLAYMLEIIISLILVLVIFILSLRLCLDAGCKVFSGESIDILNDILGNAMALAIGVEFIKMLYKHTPNTVIETLMFAIARGLVVEHTTQLENLIGVISIAVLFATKKYLFCSFSEIDRITLRGGQSVRMANLLAKIKLPQSGNTLLRDAVKEKLVEEEKEIAIGSCVYYKDFALCISNMHGDEITGVDVLKSI